MLIVVQGGVNVQLTVHTVCVDSRMGCEFSHSVFIVKRGVTVKLNLEGGEMAIRRQHLPFMQAALLHWHT